MAGSWRGISVETTPVGRAALFVMFLEETLWGGVLGKGRGLLAVTQSWIGRDLPRTQKLTYNKYFRSLMVPKRRSFSEDRVSELLLSQRQSTGFPYILSGCVYY